ncbi:PEGA domain-containing protein [Myxococcota bacterium]|nr:PEGA domain-containing protein [Myxococcota bacterium]MBU1898714.1 PEGA domain-containing protein [Myxococcota bacterium]
MRHTLLALILLIALPALAKKAPLLLLPIEQGKNVPVASVGAYEATLKAAVARHAQPLNEAAMKRATVGKAEAATCRDDACGAALAAASAARFVLATRINNSDDIYEVSLSLYDHAQRSRAQAKAVCELCAAEEVNQTIKQAVDKLKAPLSAAAAAAPPPPKADPHQAVEIQSTPAGATVFLGDVAQGQTPLIIKLKPGVHTLTLKKAGFEPSERKLTVKEGGAKLKIKLKAKPAAPAVVTPPPETTPPPSLPLPPTAPQKDLTPTGLGLGLGGAILLGVSAWLINLDGDITCDDGRGITECPNVYNTKWLGMGAAGVGGALLGAGITTLILNPGGGAPVVTPAVAPSEGGGVFLFSGRF